KLDPARELHRIAAVAQTDSRRLAIGCGACERIAQSADFCASAEIPALFRHEVDSGGAREAGRCAVLVTLLEVDAGTIGEPAFNSRDEVALADLRAVVCPLVVQRIVQVHVGQVGKEKSGSDFSAGPKVPVGSFALDAKPFRQAIGAARA